MNRLLSCLLLALSLCGCPKVGSTNVEQGERVNVGRTRFDNYFAEVQSFRRRVDDLEDDDMFKLREPLVEQLDVDVDAGIGDLMDATNKRVKKVRGYGVRLTLHLSPEPKLQVVRGGVEIDNKDENLISAIEDAAKVAFTAFGDYTQMLNQLTALEVERGKLAERIDKLPKQFASKKGMIEDEIVGAGRVLRDTERTLLTRTRAISHFLVALTTAVETGARDANVKECEEAIAFKKEEEERKTPWWKKKQRRPRWRPPAGRRPGPRPGPRPKPRPAPPPPSGGGDFEM